MKKKSVFKTTASFYVGIRLPKKLAKEAQYQLATAVTPRQALTLAAKAADIAKKFADKKPLAATA